MSTIIYDCRAKWWKTYFLPLTSWISEIFPSSPPWHLYNTIKLKENERNTNIEHRVRVRLISYFYALAGRVTHGERICWFTCHGFYPD